VFKDHRSNSSYKGTKSPTTNKASNKTELSQKDRTESSNMDRPPLTKNSRDFNAKENQYAHKSPLPKGNSKISQVNTDLPKHKDSYDYEVDSAIHLGNSEELWKNQNRRVQSAGVKKLQSSNLEAPEKSQKNSDAQETANP
jgi:hypothetical protein